MNKFIKLTNEYEDLFVNVDFISSFYRNESMNLTYLYTVGDSEYYKVEETPDEILDLINGK